MTTHPDVVVYEDRETLAAAVAERFIAVIVSVLAERDEANVVLTGGTVGIAVLEAINRSVDRDRIDWTRLNLWWGDERWLPRGHADRNDTQARAALLDHVATRPERVHWFGAPGIAADSLDAAAIAYAAELTNAAVEGALPRFDLTFLGMGPDAHIASLFPHHAGIGERQASVISVRNSPKPPPERLSLTLPTLNSSDRIWVVAAGPDKASAIERALAGSDTTAVPAAGVHGREATVFFVDSAAAAMLPKTRS